VLPASVKHAYVAPTPVLEKLSFAVVVLNPSKNDMFETESEGLRNQVTALLGVGSESLFWLLITVCVANIILWNLMLGIDRVLRRDAWVMWLQPVMVIVFGSIRSPNPK
jgi:hypothetical protein